MRLHQVVKLCLLVAVSVAALSLHTDAQVKHLYFYGNVNNDLYRLLKREGFDIKKYNTPYAAVRAAVKGAGVFITANAYPKMDSLNRITQQLLNEASKKDVKLYIEYPVDFPGLNVPAKPIETQFERGVVTSEIFGEKLKPMSLLGIHNCHVLPVQITNPLIVLAKVVGVDKAEFGLDDTPSYPLLFEQGNALVSMTGLSNFETGRYGPNESVKTLWRYIIAHVTGVKDPPLKQWRQDVKPMFTEYEKLPVNAKLNSVKNGIQWFSNGRFYVHPTWKADWIKYGSDGLKPVGPPVSQDKLNGDGSLGIIEGHTSTFYTDGSQGYRYWMRADVQGEAAMALAAAGKLLNNAEYKTKSANLIDYMFTTSNLRAGEKNNPKSAAYGLIGWATTNNETFYGDDNARAILGAICASAYLNTGKWDDKLAEAIMGNFRTTGKNGFRGERLEEVDIKKNGWPYYYNRDLVYPSPHFESWMWACYLWLYDKTKYEPLLTKTKNAIKITMQSYPEKWLWGSSLQTQRARMILPLAWLIRIEDTEEHRRWLDIVAADMLRDQQACGAIREEIGKGKGMFRELKKNSDYGTDEGSLIFKNGDEISCMIYTNNFAVFSLHEAARATNDPKYINAANILSDFLTRIQVQSEKHKDLDGAWFRAFDFGKWDYWASNSDAGWGAWCTLTGWIQSWIVTTQAQILEKQSFWEITESSRIRATAENIIKQMMAEPG